jgi:hypothetical protein
MWTEALRAFICMLPMIVFSIMGKTTYLVTLGQGAFLYSWLFLPKKLGGRIVMASMMLTIGLGLYLVGGSVAPNPFLAVIFTFITCLTLSFLSNWKVGGALALTLLMVYTSGLNTGSPGKAANNFLVFSLVIGWAAIISLPSFWKPVEPPPITNNDVGELAQQGSRMGIGASIALAISYLGGFAKLGWAPSAVGNVVRFEKELSKKRAWARVAGTLGGAALATVALLFVTSITILVWIGALFAVLNGLFKKTRVGMIPLFYTATILILYSANDLTTSGTVILQRVAYNLIGVAIGMLVVIYPFPFLMNKLTKKEA